MVWRVGIYRDYGQYGNRQYRIRLRGLKEDKRYQYTLNGSTIEKSGIFLMESGIDIRMDGDYDSVIIVVTEK